MPDANAYNVWPFLPRRRQQLRPLRLAIIAALWCVSAILSAQTRNDHAQCAKCHPAQAKLEPQTPMGRALELPGTNPVLTKHPSLKFQNGRYTYTVETRGNKTTYS